MSFFYLSLSLTLASDNTNSRAGSQLKINKISVNICDNQSHCPGLTGGRRQLDLHWVWQRPSVIYTDEFRQRRPLINTSNLSLKL